MRRKHLPFPYDGAMYGPEPEILQERVELQKAFAEATEEMQEHALPLEADLEYQMDFEHPLTLKVTEPEHILWRRGFPLLAGNVSGLHGNSCSTKDPCCRCRWAEPLENQATENWQKSVWKKDITCWRENSRTGSYHRVGEIHKLDQ